MAKPSPHRDAVAVVIPAHNAAEKLEKLVVAWGDALVRLGREYQIFVVDDGSTDATPTILEKLTGGRVKHLRALRHDTQRGFGACLRTALAEVTQPLFFYTSTDYPYAPADLRKLIDRIDARDEVLGRTPDLISGARTGLPKPLYIRWIGIGWRLLCRFAIGMNLEPSPSWQGLHEYLYGVWVGWVFGVPFDDVNSAFKLYRTEFLKRFPIQADGDFVHTELVAKATFLTSIMDELPLTPAAVTERPVSSVWKEMWEIFQNPDFGSPPLPAPAAPTPPTDPSATVSPTPPPPAPPAHDAPPPIAPLCFAV